MAKKKTGNGNGYAHKSMDPAAQEMLKVAEEKGISTMFSRVDEKGKYCSVGGEGACCKICFMGPCRFTGQNKDEKRGVCGATLGTVAARNYLRSCAGGASAHADHGRDMAKTLPVSYTHLTLPTKRIV